MKPTECFDILADKVSEICEVRKEDIINCCKSQNAINGRVLLVQYLRRLGFSNQDIARIVLIKSKKFLNITPSEKDIKKKAKCVNSIFSSYSQYCLDSKLFVSMSRDVHSFCQNLEKEMLEMGEE